MQTSHHPAANPNTVVREALEPTMSPAQKPLLDAWRAARQAGRMGAVWVVGTESTILHWNGRRFEDLSRGERYSLNDIWGRGPDDLYGVGTGGVALDYDGDEWQELESGTRCSLQSVFGDDQGRIFAAGLDGVVLVHEAE